MSDPLTQLTKQVAFSVLPHPLPLYLPQPINVDTLSINWHYHQRFLSAIIHDLSILLDATVQSFWSCFLHIASLNDFCDSYLRYARRPLDSINNNLHSVHDKENDDDLDLVLFRLMFRIYHRLACGWKTEPMLSSQQRGHIYYENWIFDIAKILDLVSLYGPGNSVETREIVECVFEAHQGYWHDLSDAMPSICQIITNLSTQLLDNNSDSDSINNINSLCESLSSLALFLDIFPFAAHMFIFDDFLLSLSKVYVVDLLKVQEFYQKINLDTSNKNNPNGSPIYIIKLKLLQNCCLRIYYNVIYHCFIDYIKNKEGNHDQSCVCTICQRVDIDEMIQNMHLILHSTVDASSQSQTESLLRDLNQKYLINNELKYIMETHSSIVDSTQMLYIIHIINDECEKRPSVLKTASTITNTHDSPPISCDDDCDVDVKVYQILDLFPDYNTESVKQYLIHYKDDVDIVINHIIEGTLPSVDQLISNKKSSVKLPEKTSDNDYSKVQIGKKSDAVLLKELNNSSEKQKLQQFFKTYEEVDEIKEEDEHEVVISDDGRVRFIFKSLELENIDENDDYDDTYEDIPDYSGDADFDAYSFVNSSKVLTTNAVAFMDAEKQPKDVGHGHAQQISHGNEHSTDGVSSTNRLNVHNSHNSNIIISSNRKVSSISNNTNKKSYNSRSIGKDINNNESKQFSSSYQSDSSATDHIHKTHPQNNHKSKKDMPSTIVSASLIPPVESVDFEHVGNNKAEITGRSRQADVKEKNKAFRANHNRKARASQKMNRGMLGPSQ